MRMEPVSAHDFRSDVSAPTGSQDRLNSGVG